MAESPPSIHVLFEQIDRGYRDLTLTLATIAEAAAGRPGALGPWSARDVLAHILGWEEEGARVLRALSDGSHQPRQIDLDAWNTAAVAARSHMGWRELQDQLAEAHAELLRTAHALPAEVWQNPRAMGWLHAVTVEHYHEHIGALQAIAATGGAAG